MKNFLGLVLLYIAALFLLHVVPTGGIETEIMIGRFDETHLVHLSLFFPWAFAGSYYINRASSGQMRRGFTWILLGLAVATFAEGAQYWLPHRSVSLADLFFNYLGVILGFLTTLIRIPRACQRSF